MNSNGMSQPLLNTKPITQHGAVKAVNLFGSYIKETLQTEPRETQASLFTEESKQAEFSRSSTYLPPKSSSGHLKVTGNCSFINYPKVSGLIQMPPKADYLNKTKNLRNLWVEPHLNRSNVSEDFRRSMRSNKSTQEQEKSGVVGNSLKLNNRDSFISNQQQSGS